MPSLLVHLTAVERLASEPEGLPPELQRALHQDLAYARFGAALSDMPEVEGWRGGFNSLVDSGKAKHFSELFHGRAPVAMGLKMAELVASGALVGTGAGLAFLAGYFNHLCLDRVLHPLVRRLVARHRNTDETDRAAHRRIDWIQTLFYLRERHGRPVVGTAEVRAHFQILKSGGPPTRGVGKGFYELIRLASQATLGEAPEKSQVDSWVRGMYLHGLMLSSPLGRSRAVPSYTNGTYRELFHAADVDYSAEVERALTDSRAVLHLLWDFIQRGHFSPRTRAAFLAKFPEEALEACAA